MNLICLIEQATMVKWLPQLHQHNLDHGMDPCVVFYRKNPVAERELGDALEFGAVMNSYISQALGCNLIKETNYAGVLVEHRQALLLEGIPLLAQLERLIPSAR